MLCSDPVLVGGRYLFLPLRVRSSGTWDLPRSPIRLHGPPGALPAETGGDFSYNSWVVSDRPKPSPPR